MISVRSAHFLSDHFEFVLKPEYLYLRLSCLSSSTDKWNYKYSSVTRAYGRDLTIAVVLQKYKRYKILNGAKVSTRSVETGRIKVNLIFPLLLQPLSIDLKQPTLLMSLDC